MASTPQALEKVHLWQAHQRALMLRSKTKRGGGFLGVHSVPWINPSQIWTELSHLALSQERLAIQSVISICPETFQPGQAHAQMVC